MADSTPQLKGWNASELLVTVGISLGVTVVVLLAVAWLDDRHSTTNRE